MKRTARRRETLSDFAWRVLDATRRIPLGETRSYRWVAEKVGRPRAVRAVGQVLRRNPFPLIVPCHRVIHTDGRVGKYAGGDDGRKAALLEMERAMRAAMDAAKERTGS